MDKYIKTLQGITYPEWMKLSSAMESYFAQKRSELDKNIKLTDTETVSKIIHSRFGQTSG